MGLVALTLSWVFSSDQCCLDMRSERESEVGVDAVESEEQQKGLKFCLFLVKMKTFPCRKFLWERFDLGCIEIF